MKYLAVFILIICLSHAVTAQSKNERLGIAVKFLPQHLLPNAYSFSGEYFLKNKPQYSFSIGFSFNPKHQRFASNSISGDKQIEHGFGIDLQRRNYFSSLKAPQSGFYYSPILRFEYFQSDYAFMGINPDSIGLNPVSFLIENKQTIISNQLGLHLGLQYVFFKHLLVDIYLGAAYRHSFSIFRNGKDAGAYYPLYSSDWFERSFDRAYSGILPKLGFQIGFAF